MYLFYKFKNFDKALSLLLNFSLLLLLLYPFLYPQPTNATLTQSFVRFDRQSTNGALSGVVCMQSTQTAPGVAKVIVQFPSTFNIGGTDTNWTVDTTAANLPNTTHGDAFTATAWPNTGANLKVMVSTTSALFLVGDLASSSNTYCFHFVGTSSNVGATGSNLTGQVVAYKSDAAGAAVVESFQYATAITNGTNSEQVQVTATVSATFSFALSGGDTNHNLPLGVLNSASTVTSPYQVTATISTNAHAGFLAWIKGTNDSGSHIGQLYSTTANTYVTNSLSAAPAVGDLASHTGYGIFAYTGVNNPTIATGYSTGPTGTSVGAVDPVNAQLIASKTSQQSGTTFIIGARGKPAATDTAATDYSDTITLTAAGSF